MRPPALSVTIDKAKMRAIERTLAEVPRALPRIMVRALKRTAAGSRTQIDKAIRADVPLKKAAVMKRIVDEQKATSINWLWRLGISGRRLALSSFPYRTSRRRGVSYTIRRGQRRRIPVAFERQMQGSQDQSYKAIFRRAGEEGRLVPRYPLVFLRGPSLGQVVEDAPALLRQVEATGAARLEREILSQVDRTLDRRWPR